jgi:hypothetical protein
MKVVPQPTVIFCHFLFLFLSRTLLAVARHTCCCNRTSRRRATQTHTHTKVYRRLPKKNMITQHNTNRCVRVVVVLVIGLVDYGVSSSSSSSSSSLSIHTPRDRHNLLLRSQVVTTPTMGLQQTLTIPQGGWAATNKNSKKGSTTTTTRTIHKKLHHNRNPKALRTNPNNKSTTTTKLHSTSKPAGSTGSTTTSSTTTGASIPMEIFNLVKNMVGAGVLGLPGGTIVYGYGYANNGRSRMDGGGWSVFGCDCVDHSPVILLSVFLWVLHFLLAAIMITCFNLFLQALRPLVPPLLP